MIIGGENERDIKKSIALLIVIGIVLNILPIKTAFASVPSNFENYALVHLNGVSSLENSNNKTSINANYDHGTLTISGTGLYSDGNSMIYVPNGSNITLDANGQGNYSGKLTINGQAINGSTKTLENLNSNNSPTIVDVNFEPENTNSTINYSYNGERAEFFVNDTFFEQERATPGINNTENSGTYNGQIGYNYDNSGTVTFNLETLFISRITSLVINGTEYATSANFPKTPDEILNAIEGQTIHYTVQVPYSNNYTISTTSVLNEGEYMTVGNFLWSYKEEDKGTDDYIGNGSFELVKVKYKGVEYTEQQLHNLNKGYMQWGQTQEEGGALLPYGAELTVRLLPDSGYQLTSFTINGGEFETGEEVGIYTFEVPRGNFHLGAHFSKVLNQVKSTDSDVVSSGSIIINGNETNIEHGTAILDVKDVELGENEIKDFKDAAGDYKIQTI